MSTAALLAPRAIDMNKANAQQTRRILDRLVGYEISPILWNKVQRGLSAGRVQSVAVRVVVEREEAIRAFIPEEYWSVETTCEGPTPPPFDARIWKWMGEKAAPKTKDEADAIAAELRAGDAVVGTVDKKEQRKRPQAPFITSRLQQDAARKLRFSAKRTMALAQRLYEGVELGDEGPIGLITYMRTDSTRVSDDATTGLRQYITETYGAEYIPAEPVQYGNRERAQDAHEAIRPTLMEWTPEKVREALVNNPEVNDLVRLYTLIWQRFVASQMVPAVYDRTTVDLERGNATLRATGQVMKFAGYTKVYEVSETDDEKAEAADAADRLLPLLEVGDAVTPDLGAARAALHPAAAALHRGLAGQGARGGRHRPAVDLRLDHVDHRRPRLRREEGGAVLPHRARHPGQRPPGGVVPAHRQRSTSPPRWKATSTTSRRAPRTGASCWASCTTRSRTTSRRRASRCATSSARRFATDFVCEKCAKPMVIKWGRNGSFLACQGYPECRNTKEVVKNLDGTYEIVPPQTTDEVCEVCAAPMTVKRGRFGSFLACTRYPDCKTTKPISLGVKCPREGCGGQLAEKRSRRGKPFYGCSYWKSKGCEFVTWDRPVPQPCPACQAKFVVKKENKRGVILRCLTCDWKSGVDDSEEGGLPPATPAAPATEPAA